MEALLTSPATLHSSSRIAPTLNIPCCCYQNPHKTVTCFLFSPDLNPCPLVHQLCSMIAGTSRPAVLRTCLLRHARLYLLATARGETPQHGGYKKPCNEEKGVLLGLGGREKGRERGIGFWLRVKRERKVKKKKSHCSLEKKKAKRERTSSSVSFGSLGLFFNRQIEEREGSLPLSLRLATRR